MIQIELVSALRKIIDVLKHPRYFSLGCISSITAYVLYGVLLNRSVFIYAVAQGDLELFISLVPLWTTGVLGTVTATGAVILLLTVILIGINIALAGFRIVEMSEFGREGAGSIGGVALATLAPACPACATSIFAVAGLSSLIGILPFGGTEIKVLAVMFLAGSAVYTARQIDREVCKLCQI